MHEMCRDLTPHARIGEASTPRSSSTQTGLDNSQITGKLKFSGFASSVTVC
jgi:hypothetical protein